ncbi:hypothetical protein [uncultured Bacteroides sp.]|uniref:hypothetical protein n=1 Tax=uncultured Bacteroides sp. TaxID=162156 RepID=UPI0026131F0D|nr:hypothetical protein [uncultured Bacteroides sp.]
MRKILLSFFISIGTIVACSQPKEATYTKEQQEFCINTFKLYLDVDKERVEESQEFIKLLLKHMEGSNGETLRWYQANIAHIDSVMHHCINLAEREKDKELLNVLEKERMNIVAHPNNTVDNEWQLHSVLALLYAKHCEDDKEYWTKLAELGEWSRMHIEAHQGKSHPLYKQVLNELIQIYDTLGNQSKKLEIEKTMCSFIETQENEY